MNEDLFVAVLLQGTVVGPFTEQELREWKAQHPNDPLGSYRLQRPPEGYPDPPASGKWAVRVSRPRAGKYAFTGPFVLRQDAKAYADSLNDILQPSVHELIQ